MSNEEGVEPLEGALDIGFHERDFRSQLSALPLSVGQLSRHAVPTLHRLLELNVAGPDEVLHGESVFNGPWLGVRDDWGA